MIFEACIDSVASAQEAIAGGAGRLELCDSLVEGGVTPSIGKISAVVRAVAGAVPVHVLIRPRGGDFVYDDVEMAIMLDDITSARSAGAAGVVVGALSPDGTVDEARTRALIEAARPMSVTFHRAIDVSFDALEVFKTAARLGVDRVLTSGHASTALEGAAVINAMVAHAHAANLRTVVIAGGGVTPGCAADLLWRTGVLELHGTARSARRRQHAFVCEPPVYMGSERSNSRENETSLLVCDRNRVADIVAAMSANAQGAVASLS